MARYLVFHTHSSDADQEQLIAGARQVAAAMQAGTTWLNSWVVPGIDKFICEWEAPSAEAVRAAVAVCSELLPIENVYEVQHLDPQWFA